MSIAKKMSAISARWDNESRKWYIPVGIDTEPFQKWMSNHLLEKKIQ